MPNRRQMIRDLLIGAIICAVVALLGRSRGQSIARVLCDGTFVAAVFLLGIGGLTFARNKGTFDVAGYGIKTVLETTLPFLRSDKKETLIEYRERKAAERKSPRTILICGSIYFVLSLIFLLAYTITG